MKVKEFESLLDRHGAKFEDWPAKSADEARALIAQSPEAKRSYEAYLCVESWLGATRPSFDSICVNRVVTRALREIRKTPERPLLLGWLGFRPMAPVSVPMPRLAFALALTAVGFAIGFLVGSPTMGQVAGPRGIPVIASADDVLF